MRPIKTDSQTPIWVTNPYTGQQVNVEPLFRFNEQPRNPLDQAYPLHRTIMVLANAKLLIHEHLQGNNMNPLVATDIKNALAGLMLALGEVEEMSNQSTAQRASSRWLKYVR